MRHNSPGRILGVLLISALATVILPSRAQDKAPAPRTLKVRLNYTGAGTVDDKHPIYVFLWDSPDFIKGQAIPFTSEPGKSKDAAVTFSDTGRSPVYVSVVFDASGNYDAQSAPPKGASLGMYMKTPGEPGAVNIDPGKSAEIDLPFDDSMKMQ